MGMSTYQGNPGKTASISINAPATQYTLACWENCLETSDPKVPSEMALVTISPVAVDIKRAGNWVISPSPILNDTYVLRAFPMDSPWIVTPVIIPPITFIAVIRIPTLTFPDTNLEAPSMAP